MFDRYLFSHYFPFYTQNTKKEVNDYKMKARSRNLRYKKKRRGCPANDKRRLDKENEHSVETSVSFVESNTPGQSNENQGVFQSIENRSNTKISSNNLFERSFEGSPSKTKLRMTRSLSQKMGLRKERDTSTSYKLLDLTLLNAALSSAAICSHCKKGCLQLAPVRKTQVGIFEKLEFHCSSCNNNTTFASSKLIDRRRDINSRSVYASQGMGYNGLVDFCATMGIPQPISRKSYEKYTTTTASSSVDLAEKLMNEAAQRLRDVDVDTNSTTVKDVAVSVDGTWQKRGHNSKIGVVFIIAMQTGEILDYEIKSLYCHLCKHNKASKSKKDFESWYENHKQHCHINHEGSSGSIERDAAIEMFLRSIDKRSLRYTQYIGDGDSSSFACVKERCLQKYGESYDVKKEECIGHIQKRMGTGLRELKRKYQGKKLTDGKAIGGAGRLTDRMIDRFQNNYGAAIRSNIGNIKGMENAIWAGFKHVIKDPDVPLEVQHDLCPKYGWCKFWRNRVEYNEDGRLPAVFKEVLKPLFTRSTNKELLSRCQSGYTQNQNESVNSVLWSKCLKTKFCGYKKVQLAVSDTVSHFNAESAAKATTMKNLGMEPSGESLRLFRLKDKMRVAQAARKITQKARQHRQHVRALKKSKPKGKCKSYKSGGFDVGKLPENFNTTSGIGVKRKLVTKRFNQNTSNEIPITFVANALKEIISV